MELNMNKIQVFRNEQFGNIRTIEIDGEPWFVGKDVAEALGYGNSRDALRYHVANTDKGVETFDTPGGRQPLAIINESGVYALILGSKLPTAQKFKHWVTAEVLPSIRRHGIYIAPNLTRSRQLCPKPDRELSTVTAIAEEYGMTAWGLNRLLEQLGIQIKINDVWMLRAPFMGRGLTETKRIPIFEGSEVHLGLCMYWTRKGTQFLYQILKAHRVCPISKRTLSRIACGGLSAQRTQKSHHSL